MKSLRVCLVIPSSNRVIAARLSDRIRLFEQICDTFYLLINNIPTIQIPGEKVQVVEIKVTQPAKGSIRPVWILTAILFLTYIALLIKMSCALLKLSKNIEIVIFASGMPFVLPLILISKIMRKRIILLVGGSTSSSFAAENPGASVSFYIIRKMERACYHLSDTIAGETESAIQFLGLDKFRNKIFLLGALNAVDANNFEIRCDLKDRKKSVGYIGNLIDGKGVMKFFDAAKLILEQREDIKFLIVGDGPLFNSMKSVLERDDLQNKIKLMGWTPHNEVPDYLNKLRLLVLPSYSEGLPMIILEAMACGTPVLATPVGGVPDLIKDGRTGFILENNSSECIRKNVIRALNHPRLDEIIINARRVIEQEYTYEVAVERYRRILEKI